MKTSTQFPNTSFIRQIKVDVTSDFKTVTGHAIMTEGIWHGIADAYGNTTGDAKFCIEHRNPPAGLPLTDESHPIGSPITLDHLSK